MVHKNIWNVIVWCVVVFVLRISAEVLEIPTTVDLTGGMFGLSAATSTNYAYVGAPYGNTYSLYQMTPITQNHGMVIVYPIDELVAERVLHASNDATCDFYGVSIATAGDLVFVACPRCSYGAVYVYDAAANFTLKAEIRPHLAAYTGFGAVVAADQDWLALTDYSHSPPSVMIYRLSSTGDYTLVQTLPEIQAWSLYGSSLAIKLDELDNVWVFVGAPDIPMAGVARAGAVYVYVARNVNKTELPVFELSQTLSLRDNEALKGDCFGASVAIAPNGLLLAVGIPQIFTGNETLNPGKILLWSRGEESFNWTRHSLLSGRGEGNANFGYSVAITMVKDTFRLIAGSPAPYHDPAFDGKNPSPGGIQLYEVTKGSTSWLTKQALHGESNGDSYGMAVAIDARRVIVGAPGATDSSGSAFSFDPSNFPLSAEAIVGCVVGAVIGTAMIVTLVSAIYFRVSGIEKIGGYAYENLGN